MRKFYFMRYLLTWLARADHFNRLIAVAMRTGAALIVPFSLVVIFKSGKVIFELPASEILGGILFEAFFIVSIYSVIHTLFIRAHEIEVLPATEYNMFPLTAILARSVGETSAAFIALVSIGGGLYVWFTAKGIHTILDPMPKILPVFGGTNFMGGIQFMVGGVLSALAILVASYLVAEVLQYVGRRAGGQPVETSTTEDSALLEEPVFRRRSGTSS